MEQIPIIPIIKREMERKHINATDLSRGLNIHYQSVVGMLKRPALHVQRLAEISECLQYNFFRELAQKLPYPEPSYPNVNEQTEIADLKARLQEMELEIKILRQTLKDLVSR